MRSATLRGGSVPRALALALLAGCDAGSACTGCLTFFGPAAPELDAGPGSPVTLYAAAPDDGGWRAPAPEVSVSSSPRSPSSPTVAVAAADRLGGGLESPPRPDAAARASDDGAVEASSADAADDPLASVPIGSAVLDDGAAPAPTDAEPLAPEDRQAPEAATSDAAPMSSSPPPTPPFYLVPIVVLPSPPPVRPGR